MKSIIASVLRFLFRSKFIGKHFYGIHKRFLIPFNILAGQTKTILVEPDLTFELHIDDWIQENIYFLNTYEPNETAYIKSILRPSDLFIDIGANIGYYTLLAAKSVTNKGKVIAFEPFETNYQRLKKNISINPYTCIQVEKLAVSDSDKRVALYYNKEENNLGTVSMMPKNIQAPDIEIEGITLDEYLKSHHVERVQMIKLDIEGGEYQALQGMINILKSHAPILMVELDDEILKDSNQNKEQILDWLRNLNYQPFYFDKTGQLTDQNAKQASKNVVFIPRVK